MINDSSLVQNSLVHFRVFILFILLASVHLIISTFKLRLDLFSHLEVPSGTEIGRSDLDLTAYAPTFINLKILYFLSLLLQMTYNFE